MNPAQDDTGRWSLGRFSLRSFRAKFVLVVGAAVVFDLALSGGVSIWNMQRLSEGARHEISEGLTQSTEQFLQTSIEMTTAQADLLLERVHSEVTMLANGMQFLIDHPDVKGDLGAAITAEPELTSPLVYSPEGEGRRIWPVRRPRSSVWGTCWMRNRQPPPGHRCRNSRQQVLD